MKRVILILTMVFFSSQAFAGNGRNKTEKFYLSNFFEVSNIVVQTVEGNRRQQISDQTKRMLLNEASRSLGSSISACNAKKYPNCDSNYISAFEIFSNKARSGRVNMTAEEFNTFQDIVVDGYELYGHGIEW